MKEILIGITFIVGLIFHCINLAAVFVLSVAFLIIRIPFMIILGILCLLGIKLAGNSEEKETY